MLCYELFPAFFYSVFVFLWTEMVNNRKEKTNFIELECHKIHKKQQIG